jgi:hypothetical protein
MCDCITIFSESEKSKSLFKRRCGCCLFSVFAVITFHILLAMALVLGFCLPRTPTIEIVEIRHTAIPHIRKPPETPPGFHDAINANVEIDNPNWLDWTIERIDAKVYDIETGKEIGQGVLEDVILYAREV